MKLKQEMKHYRKRQLSNQRQHRQNVFFLIAFELFTVSFFGFYLFIRVLNSRDTKATYQITLTSSSPSSPNCHCSKSSLVIINHGECFFDRLVCHPGFGGDHCDIELKNEVCQ